MDRISDLLSAIPGYSGYRNKEDQRDSDKRVREHISARLGQFAVRIEKVATDLANRREILAVSGVDSAAKSVRHLQNLVSSASYGYGGLGGDRDVDSLALEQIAQFDNDLLVRLETVNEPVAHLESATDGAGREAALDAIHIALDGLQTRFEERSTVVQTGRPSAPSTATSPLTVLEPESTKPLPPAAFNLKNGDALAIGGKNFLVDAVIDIEGDQAMRAFRIDIAPDRWLVVNERFAADTVVGEILDTADGATANGERLVPHGRGTATGTVTGLGGSSGRQSLSYQAYGGENDRGAFAIRLSWQSVTLNLVGAGIHLDDIELYGQPA